MGHYASEMDGSPGPNHDQRPYSSPEEIVAEVIKQRYGTYGLATKTAAAVTAALRANGWRILR